MLTKALLIDTQSSQVPQEVRNEVKNFWADGCYGNDHAYIMFGENDYIGEQCPLLVAFLKEKGIIKQAQEIEHEIYIHYWW